MFEKEMLRVLLKCYSIAFDNNFFFHDITFVTFYHDESLDFYMSKL